MGGRDEQTLQRTRGSGVIQRQGWFDALVEFVQTHPYAAIATAAAGLVAYYALRQPQRARQQPQQPEPEAEPPDFQTLAGVARIVGVEPDVLRTHLEDEAGNVNVQRLLSHPDYTAGTTKATGVVPPSMLLNLPADNPGKVRTLFNRINARQFNYLGAYYAAEIGFSDRAGDCQTLVEMLQLAAEAAGIHDVAKVSDRTPMLVESRAIHGRAGVRNVAGQAGWYFVDHHWAVHAGQRYDLLFMMLGGPQASHKNGNGAYKGVAYVTFENGAAMIDADEAKKLKTPLAASDQGYVANSVQALKAYIDQDIKVVEEVKL